MLFQQIVCKTLPGILVYNIYRDQISILQLMHILLLDSESESTTIF
jgi:hypothetical protein